MIHFFHKKNKILVSTNLKVMYSSLSHTDSLVEIKYKKFLFLKIINIFISFCCLERFIWENIFDRLEFFFELLEHL